MKTRFGRIAVILLLGIALTATACGGGDDGDSPGSTGDDGGQDTATQPGGDGETPAGDNTTTGDTPTADEGAIDACALLAVDDVTEALGAPVDEPQHEDVPPQFFGCRFDSGSGPGLTITVVAFADADEAESFITSVIENNGYSTVDGIGDQAYNTQPIGDLSVRTGRYELSVDIYGYSDDDQAELDLAIALAEKALGGLP